MEVFVHFFQKVAGVGSAHKKHPQKTGVWGEEPHDLKAGVGGAPHNYFKIHKH